MIGMMGCDFLHVPLQWVISIRITFVNCLQLQLVRTTTREEAVMPKGNKGGSPANAPSKTGNPSGKGRGNNPPKK